MKSLQSTFTKSGWLHKLVTRTQDVAIYERTLDGKRRHFEVIRIQKATRDYTFPNGSIVHAGDESYPGDSSWGRNGFTCMTLPAAQARYDKLNERTVE